MLGTRGEAAAGGIEPRLDRCDTGPHSAVAIGDSDQAPPRSESGRPRSKFAVSSGVIMQQTWRVTMRFDHSGRLRRCLHCQLLVRRNNVATSVQHAAASGNVSKYNSGALDERTNGLVTLADRGAWSAATGSGWTILRNHVKLTSVQPSIGLEHMGLPH